MGDIHTGISLEFQPQRVEQLIDAENNEEVIKNQEAALRKRGKYVSLKTRTLTLESESSGIRTETETAFRELPRGSGSVTRTSYPRFAGVWFSDTGVMVRSEKRDENWITGPHNGVVAVAGVVPILCCPKDLNKFTQAGQRVYLKHTDSRVYVESTVTGELDGTGAGSTGEYCTAITGEFSHQQLAVGAVSIEPPVEGTDVRYGVPQFAPVIFSRGEIDRLPKVNGASHTNGTSLDGLDRGFRVYGICPESEIAENSEARERTFIGTFVERLGASGAMVNLGAALVHSA